jgi:hypothetical protein
LLEEIIGYGVLILAVISNDKAYTCFAETYKRKCQRNSNHNYIPKSRRRKDIMYLWWLEPYDTVLVPAWQKLIQGLKYMQPVETRVGNYWKGRNIRRSPKIADKRIARSNSQSYRKLALARMAMVQVMKTRAT